MRFSVRLLPLALACSLVPGGPAWAAPAPATAPAKVDTAKFDKAYVDLADAMVGMFDLDLIGSNMAGQIYDAMIRNSPDFAEQAKGKPGLRGRFVGMIKPYFSLWMPRSMALMRNQLVPKFAQILTIEEAQQLTAFYASPLGRKFGQVASGSLTVDAQLDSTMQGGDRFDDRDAEEDDLNTSTSRMYKRFLASLSPEEQEQMLAFAKTPVYKKIAALNRAMDSITAPELEDISTPEERDGFNASLKKFFEDEDLIF